MSKLLQTPNEYEELVTPVPAAKHTYCHVCGTHFGEGGYKEHIRGEGHALAVKGNMHNYSQIDRVINDLDEQLKLE